jgi:FkbM family methyltransferase
MMSKFLLRMIDCLPRPLTEWILRKRHESPMLARLTARFASSFRHQEAQIGSGIGKGLFINVGSSAAAYVLGTFKPDLQTYLSSNVKAGNVFYDVGANVGFFSLLAARLIGPHGNVISFEPLPENLRSLRANVERNRFANVKILPFALGAANGEQVFQVSERPTWGKLKDVGTAAPDKYLTDIKVIVRRLDDLVIEGAIPPPDFVKIDVEGAEVEVVEGAIETLSRHGPALIIELHGTGNLLTQVFARIGYCAIPLNGKSQDVAQAHWNATILACPSQQAVNLASARGLSRDSLGALP